MPTCSLALSRQDLTPFALARQVEVEPPAKPDSRAATKAGNLEKLKERADRLGVSSYYFEVARVMRDSLAAYEWPNQSGFSYYLQEMAESGAPSNRAYLALFLHDSKPGKILVRLLPRAVSAARALPSGPPQCFDKLSDLKENGGAELLIKSLPHWQSVEECAKSVCAAVVEGWKQRTSAEAEASTSETLSPEA